MYLLLLPEPPTEISLSTFKAAYDPGLRAVFSQLRQSTAEELIILDICISCNKIASTKGLPRSTDFAYIQRVLKQLYSLIACVLAEESSVLHDDRLDIRILILDSNNGDGSDQMAQYQGPILSLKDVSQASRQWTDVFGLDGEVGESLLQAFIHERKSQSTTNIFNIHRVPGGSVVKLENLKLGKSLNPHEQGKQDYHYSIAVGGTFDHLHLGHKLLLTATALALDPPKDSVVKHRILTIGITTTALLLNKAHASVLESWSTREQSVIKFLVSILESNAITSAELTLEKFDKDDRHGTAIHYTFPNGLLVRCVEIDDAYGPTITDEDIDALVVSAETRKGGAAVNQKRREKSWRDLDVFEVDVLDANPNDTSVDIDQDFKSKISSTEIRKRIEERRQQSTTHGAID